MFKTKMLSRQSKASLDEKILFGKIKGPAIRKIPTGFGWELKIPCSIDLLAILQKSLNQALFLYNLIYTRGLIEWHWSLYHYCAHSKILQNAS